MKIYSLIVSLICFTCFGVYADTFQLQNAGISIDIEFPSVEANSLTSLDNVDGPIMIFNSAYAYVPGRSIDGVIGSWQGRILDGGLNIKLYDYLNKTGPVWTTKFYTRDYPFCFFAKSEVPTGDQRYRVFTQRETDFVQINPENVPVYSQIGIYKASRINSNYATQLTSFSHWQDVVQCCYIDVSNQTQLPAGLKGVVLVHVEPVDESTALIYYTRIIDTRRHNYNHDFEHGYPTYMNPRIEPPAVGANDWHRPNLCVAEFNVKTNKITRYYNGQFESNQKYDSGLLDRPAMYGRIVNFEGTLLYFAQSFGNVGIHVFSSQNYLDWEYECTIPISNAFHPQLAKLDDGSFVFYFNKDRDKQYTFGLRAAKATITKNEN